MRFKTTTGISHPAESRRTRASITPEIHRTPPKLPNGALDYAYSIVRNAIHFSDNYPPGFIAGRSMIHQLRMKIPHSGLIPKRIFPLLTPIYYLSSDTYAQPLRTALNPWPHPPSPNHRLSHVPVLEHRWVRQRLAS